MSCHSGYLGGPGGPRKGFWVLGSRDYGLGFEATNSGFRGCIVWGWGLRVLELGFRFWGVGMQHLGFSISVSWPGLYPKP